MKKSKKSKIPRFRSFQEEAEFWDTHDSTEFLRRMKPAKLQFPKPRKRLVSMRLPESGIIALKRVAARKGVGYLTLVRIWVIERLFEELEKAA